MGFSITLVLLHIMHQSPWDYEVSSSILIARILYLGSEKYYIGITVPSNEFKFTQRYSLHQGSCHDPPEFAPYPFRFKTEVQT